MMTAEEARSKSDEHRERMYNLGREYAKSDTLNNILTKACCNGHDEYEVTYIKDMHPHAYWRGFCDEIESYGYKVLEIGFGGYVISWRVEHE